MTYPTSIPPQQPAWPPAPPTIQSPFGAPASFAPGGFTPPLPTQLSYGAGPQGFPPAYPPADQAPPRRRKWLLAGAGVGLTAVIAGAAVGGWWFVNADNESDAIIALVPHFAAAADTGDPAAVVGYLCMQEAEALKKVMRVDASGAVTDAAPKAGVSAADVVVKGALASAMLTNAGQHQKTVYFRKESGQWKVCVSAEKEFQAAV